MSHDYSNIELQVGPRITRRGGWRWRAVVGDMVVRNTGIIYGTREDAEAAAWTWIKNGERRIDTALQWTPINMEENR